MHETQPPVSPLTGTNPLVNFNHTDTRCCKPIEIGIGNDSNIDKALEIMVEEVLNHPLHIDGRTRDQMENNTPEVVARVVAVADSSVELKLWPWAKDAQDRFVLLS